jgi:hypothetical protein
MTTLLRHLLLYVLMLALPLSGIASVGACAAHGTAQTVQTPTNAVLPCVEHVHTAKTIQPGNGEQCSAAACCIGAVLPTAILVTADVVTSSQKIDFYLSSYTGPIANGPDRPPQF